MSLTAATTIAALRGPIAVAYLADEGARGLARSLLLVVAAFQVADALQVVAAGALRGVERTRVAMRWGLVGYVVVAPAVAAVLVGLGLRGALGVWIGLAAGLFLAALALTSATVRGSAPT